MMHTSSGNLLTQVESKQPLENQCPPSHLSWKQANQVYTFRKKLQTFWLKLEVSKLKCTPLENYYKPSDSKWANQVYTFRKSLATF